MTIQAPSQRVICRTNEIRDTMLCLQITVNYEGWKFNSDNYLFTTDTK